MANPRHATSPRTQKMPGKGAPTSKGSMSVPRGPDRTANWGGAGGPTQSKPRSTSGERKVKQSAKQDGL